MDAISISMWLLALVMGAVAYSRPVKLHIQGVKIAGENLLVMVPRIIMAILVSGFFAVIVPTDLVAAWLGKDSGMKGILVGFLAGGLTPGGPIICFPIIAVFFKAGAGVAPLIAFLTSWSLFALHRMFAYEIPMMGPRFAAIRVLSSVILPFIAAISAMVLETFFMGN
ncbi:MAG: hypothetical protein AB1427_03655 [Thermodesulfobacteriota bacterium]